MRTGLELRVSVLVWRLGDVPKLQQVRSGVLGQDGAGLVGNLRVKLSLSHSVTGTAAELEMQHFWFRKKCAL